MKKEFPLRKRDRLKKKRMHRFRRFYLMMCKRYGVPPSWFDEIKREYTYKGQSC